VGAGKREEISRQDAKARRKRRGDVATQADNRIMPWPPFLDEIDLAFKEGIRIVPGEE
jgi:hypothetical protein